MSRNESPSPDDEAQSKPPGPQQPPRAALGIALVVSIVGLVAAIVAGAALWFSGAWSGPSKSDPAASVDGFLTALLENHDSDEAASYMCQSLSGDLSQGLDVGEAAAQAGDDGLATFSWDNLEVASRSKGSALVSADVTLEAAAATQTWSFAMVTGDPDSAWRVCGITIDESE